MSSCVFLSIHITTSQHVQEVYLSTSYYYPCVFTYITNVYYILPIEVFTEFSSDAPAVMRFSAPWHARHLWDKRSAFPSADPRPT